MVLLRKQGQFLNDKFKKPGIFWCHERQKLLLLFCEQQIQKFMTGFFHIYVRKIYVSFFTNSCPFRSGLFCIATAAFRTGGGRWDLRLIAA